MADGYLESRQQEYEKRKTAWLLKKDHAALRNIPRPENEAL